MNRNNTGIYVTYEFSYDGKSEAEPFDYEIPDSVLCDGIRAWFDFKFVTVDGTDNAIWNAVSALGGMDEITESEVFQEFAKGRCEADAFEEFKDEWEYDHEEEEGLKESGSSYADAQARAYRLLKSKKPYAVIYAYSQGKGKRILDRPLPKKSQAEVQAFVDGFKTGKEAQKITADVFYLSQLGKIAGEFEPSLKEAVGDRVKVKPAGDAFDGLEGTVESEEGGKSTVMLDFKPGAKVRQEFEDSDLTDDGVDESYRWHPSQAQKREFAKKMDEIDEFCRKNGIDSSSSGDSYYFTIDGQDYRVSNHSPEASYSNSHGRYHCFDGSGERDSDTVYINAGKTRIEQIYNDLKAGKKLDGNGRAVFESFEELWKSLSRSAALNRK